LLIWSVECVGISAESYLHGCLLVISPRKLVTTILDVKSAPRCPLTEKIALEVTYVSVDFSGLKESIERWNDVFKYGSECFQRYPWTAKKFALKYSKHDRIQSCILAASDSGLDPTHPTLHV
jgi:hypothetical protein